MAKQNLKPVTQLFKESSAAVRRNLGLFVALSSLSLLSVAWQIGSDLHDKVHGTAWSGIFKNSFLGRDSSYPHWGGGLIVFVFIAASVILGLLAVLLTVRAAKQTTVKFEEVWADFKRLWLRLIGVELLSIFLICGSFILLVIPGILVLPRLILAPYLLVDRNVGVMEALNRSWEMTKGYFGAIWIYVLFGLLLSLLNVIPAVGPLIGFAVGMLYSVAGPLRYFEIKQAK